MKKRVAITPSGKSNRLDFEIEVVPGKTKNQRNVKLAPQQDDGSEEEITVVASNDNDAIEATKKHLEKKYGGKATVVSSIKKPD
ncbi:hypothetical protein [Gimesia sp.]|uniref:hypothetical protein n=1 Tax=Gimesia sp. TaxID=2024833 RepID=UPI003A8CB87E